MMGVIWKTVLPGKSSCPQRGRGRRGREVKISLGVSNVMGEKLMSTCGVTVVCHCCDLNMEPEGTDRIRCVEGCKSAGAQCPRTMQRGLHSMGLALRAKSLHGRLTGEMQNPVAELSQRWLSSH